MVFPIYLLIRKNGTEKESPHIGDSTGAAPLHKRTSVSQSVSQSVIRQAARGHVWRGTPFAARRGGFVQVWLLHGDRPKLQKLYSEFL